MRASKPRRIAYDSTPWSKCTSAVNKIQCPPVLEYKYAAVIPDSSLAAQQINQPTT